MTGKKLLLFTFDYELFLGDRSGSVQDCLITPTDQLISLLHKYDFKSYFFVDTVYLLRLKEAALVNPLAKADLDRIFSQLVQIVKKGHEIYPHIHPHWLDAIYDATINEWCLTEKRYYKFSSISQELQTSLFEESVKIIHSILAQANQKQPVDSYRAGGWSIQPFNNFIPWFLKHGIKHEFSVLPGMYQFSDAQSFDFRKAPENQAIYPFHEDTCLKDETGPFTEWTISSIILNRYEKWFDFKISGFLNRTGRRPALKGKGVSSIINKEGDSRSGRGHRRVIASFEGLNLFRVKKYITSISKLEYFHFISHPKIISPYDFRMLDNMFGKLKAKFEIQTDFRKTIS